MSVRTKGQGRWTGTWIALLGLVTAAVALIAPLAFSREWDGGPALVPGLLLLITAGLVWRFGLAAHILAAVVGAWLLLTFGWYTIGNISGFPASVGVVITEAVAAIGGGVTLVGAVRYLRGRRRAAAVNRPLGPLPTEVGGEAVATTRGLYHVLAGLALAVQIYLLFRSFVMGLGWGGFWYVANLGQAAAIAVLAIAWFRKHPLRVLPVVVASFLLTQVLLAVDPSLKTTQCTPAELSAAAELPPPPGSPAPDFKSEPDSGCITRFYANITGDKLLEHYQQAASTAGWKAEKQGMVELETGEVIPGEITMKNDTMTFEVFFEGGGQEGPRDRLFVVLSVAERIR